MSDLISRQAMIDTMRKRKALFCKNRIEFMALPNDEKARVDEIDNCISNLVNAPDAELEVFEFCASGENPCKEYDQQNHCCHRWTKVIRQTVEELKAQKSEITAIVEDFGHPCGTYGYCSNCGGYCVNEEPYCPHCGAKVEWR